MVEGTTIASSLVMKVGVFILLAFGCLSWLGIPVGIQQRTTTTTTTTTTTRVEKKSVQKNPRPPVKVFLMVGQSNMQGHGYMMAQDDAGHFYNGTIPWMMRTQPEKYAKLLQKDGSWTKRNDVWVAYNREGVFDVRSDINQHGPLVPGFGGDPGETDQMGPELGFGWTLGEAMNPHYSDAATSSRDDDDGDDEEEEEQQQILLLKLAWGGRSLAVEFRPPSSQGGTTGLYYEAVIANTYKTLSMLDQLFPTYDAGSSSYELAGFAWHQGWNDGCDVNMTAEYESNLANLIRDIRHDLNKPKLPVTVAVSGFNGYYQDHSRRDAIVAAQFAVGNATKYPEFAGNVKSVDTRAFKRDPLPDSPGTQGYHWNNNCETYWLIGEAMAKAMLEMIGGHNKSDGDTGGGVTAKS
jgi:Carbohydrate esterase, sialic acid-specific acetylesterase